MCYSIKFCRSSSNRLGVIVEIRQKMLTLASRLSRSLELTPIDRLPMTSYFVPYYYGSILNHFRYDNCKLFQLSRIFYAPAERVPLERRWGSKTKTRMIPLPDCQKCDDMSIRLDTVPTWDGRTGGLFAITTSRSGCGRVIF